MVGDGSKLWMVAPGWTWASEQANVPIWAADVDDLDGSLERGPRNHFSR